MSVQAKKIAVLYGGLSAEREISLQSGSAVIEALRSTGYEVIPVDMSDNFLQQVIQLQQEKVDRVFIALHGGAGEGGAVQAVLDMANITYTGSSPLACGLALNKVLTKQIWLSQGLMTPEFQVVDKNTQWQDVTVNLGERIIIKPASEGSSIGMRVANDDESYMEAIEEAFKYDNLVLAEQWIEGEEYTVAILAGQTLPVIKLQTPHEFYDFSAKYQSDETQYICPCGLSEKDEREMAAMALDAFDVLGCSGWGRVDVMRNQNGENFLLEVNTVPGLTSHSLVPMAAKAVGSNFQKLIVDILQA